MLHKIYMVSFVTYLRSDLCQVSKRRGEEYRREGDSRELLLCVYVWSSVKRGKFMFSKLA